MGELTREAVARLAVEAGVIRHTPDNTAVDACALGGDLYYAELVAECHVRLRRLSEGYERLRAAAHWVHEAGAPLGQRLRDGGHTEAADAHQLLYSDLGDCLATDLRGGAS